MYILFNEDNYKSINDSDTDRVRVMLKNRSDMLGTMRSDFTALPSTLALLTGIVDECNSTLYSFEVVKELEDGSDSFAVFKAVAGDEVKFLKLSCANTAALMVTYVTQQLQAVYELNKELKNV